MHLVEDRPSQLIGSIDDLYAYFAEASKPRDAWRMGTEIECIGVRAGGATIGSAPSYEEEGGIGALLQVLTGRGWEPVRERGHIIALVKGNSQVTIEPGGQLELAARPVVYADELKADLKAFLADLAEPSQRFGLAWLSIGFRPFQGIADVPWMPKERYEVMREYMPTRGALAHEMMKRTATVQVNLDYGDVTDAGEKMRAAMSTASILTALYANSPVVDGKLSGYQSYRSRVWRDTDPDRCGLLDFAFQERDVFAAYTQWALDVPMFFVYRGGYQPAGGMTFRRFWQEGFQGHHATMDDWALHLSTLFPEARMKRFIEIRGCDSGSLPMVLALGPLCAGLYYDAEARAAASALTAGLTMSERRELSVAVAKDGLRAQVPGRPHTVGELAKELCAIAAAGLARYEPRDVPYLDPVIEIAESGRTQADAVIELWERTGGKPAEVIPALAHRRLE